MSAVETLVDFSQPGARPWPALDDVVMGGRSRSAMLLEGGVAVFAGEVSLEQGGGFASVRSAPGPWALPGRAGLRLRVRGDSRRYRLRLRTDAAFDGVAWERAFTATPSWTEVELPFAGFVATFRGSRVPQAGPLDPGRIVTLGLMIADRQAGPFRLELARIEAWR